MKYSTEMQKALSQCGNEFERQNCLAILRLADKGWKCPEGEWFTVTAVLIDGTRKAERMLRASLDSAVSSMRELCRWKGWEYTAIESRAD